MKQMTEHCGERVPYYGHFTGLCMREPHDDSVDHLVEMVTPDTKQVRYDQIRKENWR